MSEVQTTIEQVTGFQAAGVACDIKKTGALDLALIVSEKSCAAAGVFTTNRVKAAPVLIDMARLQSNPGGIRAVVTNSGCANACTGSQGIANAEEMARLVAQQIGCDANDVLVLSTGVIGAQLPMGKIANGVKMAAGALGDHWLDAATAIMTTDTRPKMASMHITKSNGETYQIAGMVKGAGMIAPNMATMLSTMVTDAALTPQDARQMLTSAVNMSYNCISIDGDTSTNDTVFLLANGASRVQLTTPEDCEQFQQALNAVSLHLAQAVVRDGEGVTKFITVRVEGAPDHPSARQIANTIANSPLVKTAFYGNDANWGRIAMAAGRAGINFEQEKMALWITAGEDFRIKQLQLVSDGMPLDYGEAAATAIIKEPSACIILDCGAGDGTATVWTCDLSHEYVSINADYRT
jgi:glutamate N-acetyltransferase/amino-acid N-acetyltransferase